MRPELLRAIGAVLRSQIFRAQPMLASDSNGNVIGSDM
jgi:hypothetical protein